MKIVNFLKPRRFLFFIPLKKCGLLLLMYIFISSCNSDTATPGKTSDNKGSDSALKAAAAPDVVLTGKLNVLFHDISTPQLRAAFISYLERVIAKKAAVVLHAYHTGTSNITYGAWFSDGEKHQDFDPQKTRILEVAGAMGADISTTPFFLGDQDFGFSDVGKLLDALNLDTNIKYVEFYPTLVTINSQKHLIYWVFTDSVRPTLKVEQFSQLQFSDIPDSVFSITKSKPVNIRSDPSPPAPAH